MPLGAAMASLRGGGGAGLRLLGQNGFTQSAFSNTNSSSSPVYSYSSLGGAGAGDLVLWTLSQIGLQVDWTSLYSGARSFFSNGGLPVVTGTVIQSGEADTSGGINYFQSGSWTGVVATFAKASILSTISKSASTGSGTLSISSNTNNTGVLVYEILVLTVRHDGVTGTWFTPASGDWLSTLVGVASGTLTQQILVGTKPYAAGATVPAVNVALPGPYTVSSIIGIRRLLIEVAT